MSRIFGVYKVHYIFPGAFETALGCNVQPSKTNPLNKELLQKIKVIVEDTKEKQAWKASGISNQQSEGAWQ